QVPPATKKPMRAKAAVVKLDQIVADPSLVKELHDHDLLYADKRAEPALRFLLQEPLVAYDWKRNDLTAAERIRVLLEDVNSIGSDLIYYNLTPADMQRLGLYTCRVIIPHLQAIHFGFQNIRLGGTRMFTQSKHLGFST